MLQDNDILYLNPQGVKVYTDMVEGENGLELINKLLPFLQKGSSLLEIGMGPGIDLDLLTLHYRVTGSDYSPFFLDSYRNKHPEADLLQLEATTLSTDRTFDGIYSNKVLHHLTNQELRLSIQAQSMVLNKGGRICHSFWKGNKSTTSHGLLFNHHTLQEVEKLFEPSFTIDLLELYGEFDGGDSILMIATKK